MWRSATSSDRAGPSGLPATVAALGVAALLGLPAPAAGQVRLTREEALDVAFPPPARVERHTAYLDEAQLARIERDAGVEADGRVITYYVGRTDEEPLGVAYFDAHRVRTMPEVLMIVVDPAGRVDRIEILRFAEPHEYMAPEGWLEQFEGHGDARKLGGADAIVGITGATLTSRAVTAAVRRTLALHALLDPLGGGRRSEGEASGP